MALAGRQAQRLYLCIASRSAAFARAGAPASCWRKAAVAISGVLPALGQLPLEAQGPVVCLVV